MNQLKTPLDTCIVSVTTSPALLYVLLSPGHCFGGHGEDIHHIQNDLTITAACAFPRTHVWSNVTQWSATKGHVCSRDLWRENRSFSRTMALLSAPEIWILISALAQ